MGNIGRKTILALLAFLSPLAVTCAAGLPAVPVPDGYAQGTTGGGNAAPVTVCTAADFKAKAGGNQPAVIIVNGRLNVGDVATPTAWAWGCTDASGKRTAISTMSRHRPSRRTPIPSFPGAHPASVDDGNGTRPSKEGCTDVMMDLYERAGDLTVGTTALATPHATPIPGMGSREPWS